MKCLSRSSLAIYFETFRHEILSGSHRGSVPLINAARYYGARAYREQLREEALAHSISSIKPQLCENNMQCIPLQIFLSLRTVNGCVTKPKKKKTTVVLLHLRLRHVGLISEPNVYQKLASMSF